MRNILDGRHDRPSRVLTRDLANPKGLSPCVTFWTVDTTVPPNYEPVIRERRSCRPPCRNTQRSFAMRTILDGRHGRPSQVPTRDLAKPQRSFAIRNILDGRHGRPSQVRTRDLANLKGRSPCATFWTADTAARRVRARNDRRARASNKYRLAYEFPLWRQRPRKGSFFSALVFPLP